MSVRSRIVLLVIAGVCTFVMVYPAGVGQRPSSHDHAVHFAKAWQFRHQLVEEGRLWGWSDLWFAGYPMLYHYPPGGEIFVTAVHVALLGLVDLSAAYGIAIWLVHLLVAVAVFRLGASASSPAVGIVAAAMFLAESGGHDQYVGWHWTVEFGVWPAALSLACCLLAVSQIWSLARPGNGRSQVLLAAFVAAALVGHPLAIVHLGLMLPAAAVLITICHERRVALAMVGRLATGAAAGALLSGVFLLPFLATLDSQVRQGWTWKTWREFGNALVDGRIDGSQLWIYPMLLGAVGGLALLLAREPQRLLIGVGVFLPILVGSSSFVDGLGLAKLWGALGDLQYPRFHAIAFPYTCVAAAFVLVGLFRYAYDEGWPARRAGQPWRAAALLLVGLLLTAPILVPAGQELTLRVLGRRPAVASEAPDLGSREAFVEWLSGVRATDPRPFRVAVIGPLAADHRQADLVTRVAAPIYLGAVLPAVHFANVSGRADAATLAAVNVRYVVTDGGWPADLPVRPVARLGSWRVFEFVPWSGQLVDAGSSPDAVTVTGWSSNEVVLEVARDLSTSVRIGRAYFDRWRATGPDGEVRLVPVTVPGVTIDFLGLDRPTAGTYEISFVAGLPEKLGVASSALGALLCVALAVLARRRFRKPEG